MIYITGIATRYHVLNDKVTFLLYEMDRIGSRFEYNCARAFIWC